MSDHEFEMTVSVNFCSTVSRAEVEGRSPFEVAALLQSRLDPDGFFIFGARIELKASDGSEFREATFQDIDYDFLVGIFTGGKGLELEYLRNVSPDQRASWTVPDDSDLGEPTEDTDSER